MLDGVGVCFATRVEAGFDVAKAKATSQGKAPPSSHRDPSRLSMRERQPWRAVEEAWRAPPAEEASWRATREALYHHRGEYRSLLTANHAHSLPPRLRAGDVMEAKSDPFTNKRILPNGRPRLLRPGGMVASLPNTGGKGGQSQRPHTSR